MDNINEQPNTNSHPGSDGNLYQVSLLDLAVILVRQRFFIIKFTTVFALAVSCKLKIPRIAK